MEVLQRTLDQMQVMFTSNQFADVARKNGLTQEIINSGIIPKFLHEKCVQQGSKRLWAKKDSIEVPDKLQEAIKLIKSCGYRVLKPVNDYIEI